MYGHSEAAAFEKTEIVETLRVASMIIAEGHSKWTRSLATVFSLAHSLSPSIT